MKIKVLSWLLIVVCCSMMSIYCQSGQMLQGRVQVSAIPLEAVIDQINLLVQQGYTLEQILIQLQRISLPGVSEQHMNHSCVEDKDNILQLMIVGMLLGAVGYGLYVYIRPYMIEQEERARVGAKKKMVVEAWNSVTNDIKDIFGGR